MKAAPSGGRFLAERLLYRIRQLRQALVASPQPEDLELAASVLTPPQLALFQSMQPSEQAHAVRVLRALQASGEFDPGLAVAALLHDAGKSRCPLSAWERVLIVVVGALCPACLARWGSAIVEEDEGKFGWRKPFVVALQHPRWGAEMAAAAGATHQAVDLIRRHQDQLPLSQSDAETLSDHYLRALQAVDNNS